METRFGLAGAPSASPSTPPTWLLVKSLTRWIRFLWCPVALRRSGREAHAGEAPATPRRACVLGRRRVDLFPCSKTSTAHKPPASVMALETREPAPRGVFLARRPPNPSAHAYPRSPGRACRDQQELRVCTGPAPSPGFQVG